MARNFLFSPGQNNLIATLPENDRALLSSTLEPVTLDRGMILEAANMPIKRIYFPVSGIASVLAIHPKGRRVEAGLFGRDGMTGLSLLIEIDRSPNETLIQVPGHGFSISGDTFRRVLEESASLRRHLLRFVQALMAQTSQTALTNAQMKLEKRLARWLLMCHDRVDGNRLDLTHEFLSIMLGVRRAGVTEGTHALEGKRLIRAERGCIEVLDREGLEREAEGSYGVPEAEYKRLFGETGKR